MPILERDLFYRFGVDDPFGDFKSRLPPASIMEGASVSPLFAEILGTFPAAQTLNGARHVQAIAARASVTRGIEERVLKTTEANPVGRFAALLSKHIGEAPALGWTDSGKKLVNDLGLQILDMASAEIITKVPVVGWVAQAGIFLAKIAMQLREDIDRAAPKAYRNAILYDREADNAISSQVLGVVENGEELTTCFMPSVAVSGFDVGNTQDTTESGRTAYGAEGIQLTPTGTDRTGLSLVPGLAEIGDVVQYPDKNVNGVGRGTPSTMGQLAPSAAQLSLILWQSILRNSPLAFQIDGPKIADAWEAYYDALIRWAELRPNGQWADHHWVMVSKVAGWAAYGTKVSTVKGMGKFFPERQSPGANLPATPTCPADRYCVPRRYCQWRGRVGTPLIASRGGLVRYIVEQQWQARLRYYLGTLTCAYVPHGAPALRSVDGLAAYHDEMRKLLLKHKARYKVDMDMVPDDGTGFRGDLIRSTTAAQTKGLAAAPSIDTPEPKIKPTLATLVDDVPPVDPGLEGASPNLAPPTPAIPGPSVESGALVSLLIAAGAGALLLGTLKGVK